VLDNLETEFLGRFGFAVMLAREGHERFGKADEADGKRSVLDDLATVSSQPSLSESIHTPCPMRNGKFLTLRLLWTAKRSMSWSLTS